jgi:CRISPR-associated endonuclease/helicase Cas3
MSSLNPAQFDEFFHALYGCDPFPWQARLARRVAGARGGDAAWPEALALPTAAGKTACIDMAVFALACQVDRPSGERAAPRRVFFVVDRRVIVDATFRRARDLALRLQEARTDGDGILKEVAGRLGRLARGEGLAPEEDCSSDDPGNHPLAVFQLRGGMYRDDSWARSPLQATVIVTTVDQFASRLLFRGYGSSPGMRPIHAGLAANDCLIVLDEAHCANPFRQTVDAVRRYRQWAGQSGGVGSVPFHLTLLSATPPAEIEDTLRDEDDDRSHQVLGPRIKASKPARLVEAGNRRNAEAASGMGDALERLAERIAAEAKALVSEERRNIGVMVNRVHTARLVYQRLKQAGEEDVTLLTGRMRPIDRDDIGQALMDALKTNAPHQLERPPAESPAAAGNGQTPLPDGPEPAGPPRFVVATQCLEVGADLDFDGLVTECASLDALRQRFGRLNRAGRSIEAGAVIVVRADQTSLRRGDERGDPIYGKALTETWQWLREKSERDVIDLGYGALERLLPSNPAELNELRQRLSPPAPNAPVMLPAHVDAWVQTAPTPAPDPDVTLFLHGPRRGAPEVQVCWRADLSPEDMFDEELAAGIVSLCPPSSPECIPVPIHNFRRWLERGESSPDFNDSDVEGVPAPARDFPSGAVRGSRSALCWRGAEESYLIAGSGTLDRLRPGDTVVIPAQLKGWEVFGHIPPGTGEGPVVDLGDRAHLQSRARPILRIRSEVVEKWPPCSSRTCFMEMAGKSEDSEDSEDEERLRVALEELATSEVEPQWQWLKDAADALTREYRSRRIKRVWYPGKGGGFVLQGSRRMRKYMASASTPTSEDDSYSATVRVPLDKHLHGVEEWARRFGAGVGLPVPLIEDLALAARLHDVGKSDPRFQAMLHGGNSWAAQAAGVLLAKSGDLPTSRRESRRASRESGYPAGGRHELLSVRLIESVPGLLEPAHDGELVLHLVASHHGLCRPFAPVVFDREPVTVEDTILGHRMSASSATGLERLDSGVSERFWRLVRRYGWWGLAWLEALMRLADHRCSEAEQLAHEEAEDGVREAGG